MSRLKKNVFKTALALIIILLVLTLFSKTVYNLMLPEVKKEAMSEGSLNTSATFSFEAVVGENNTAAMSLGYDQLEALLENGDTDGTVFALEGENREIPVSFSVESYEYNEETGLYDTGIAITSDEPLTQGLPLRAGFTVQKSSGSYILVPLNCIYYDGTGYYVYRLEERETLWGKGQIVRRVDVELLGSDYVNGAVNLNDLFTVVSSTSSALYDGANVKVAQ